MGRFLWMLAAVAVAAACTQRTPFIHDAPPRWDGDGDCISDADEGADARVDTDGDGTPDSEDDDSDGDGISDASEGMSGGCAAALPPADSDGDGVPNFRDLDSDDNGVGDRHDGQDDPDEDGVPSFADLDDDGDLVPDVEEIGADPADPADSDADGIPDYHDTDSDDDTIRDSDERGADTDGDGLVDRIDLDSDGDGIPDADEAGDADPLSPPRDTDGDLVADFRDRDSDDDGLEDGWEHDHAGDVGTDPLRPDTDDDGSNDWIEVEAGSDPVDGTELPGDVGVLVFVTPYLSAAEPEARRLLHVEPVRADLFVVLDLTGGLEEERAELADDLDGAARRLGCDAGELPGTSGCVHDLWLGFGWFTHAFGPSADSRALQVERNLTSSFGSVVESIPGRTLSGATECQRRAVYCSVVGPDGEHCPEALTVNMDTWPCRGSLVGFPCFRPEAARMLALITDDDMDDDPVPDYDVVAEALRSAGITFLGISAAGHGASGVVADLTEIAVRAGSFDDFGAPLVVVGSGEEVVDALEEVVRGAVRAAPTWTFDIGATAVDAEGDDVDATGLLEGVEVDLSGDDGCVASAEVADLDGDGLQDAYLDVTHGVPLCWQVRAGRNDFIPASDGPRAVRASLRIEEAPAGPPLADWTLLFVVPARPSGP